ncbi:MAG TPA: hypothetical protein VGS99_01830, partial [Gammaproteobacteria bacterium]|nr:hypothetical protein [Gammaproteobacteria bacterium]
TDFAVRTWYRFQNRSVDASFANPMSNPAPQAAAVQGLTSMLRDVIVPWLQQAGADTAQFNPISTPFQANGTGFDRVLDESRADPATGRITISDGINTATCAVSLDETSGKLVLTNNPGSVTRSYSVP